MLLEEAFPWWKLSALVLFLLYAAEDLRWSLLCTLLVRFFFSLRCCVGALSGDVFLCILLSGVLDGFTGFGERFLVVRCWLDLPCTHCLLPLPGSLCIDVDRFLDYLRTRPRGSRILPLAWSRWLDNDLTTRRELLLRCVLFLDEGHRVLKLFKLYPLAGWKEII